MRVLRLFQSYLRCYQGLPIPCWRGVILALVESSLTKIFYFLTIYFVHDLQMTMATAGVLISCYGAGAIVGGYSTGILAAQLSLKKIIIMSLFTQAFCYGLLVSLHVHIGLSCLLFILGVATYSFITANHLAVLAACGRQDRLKVKAINLLSTASNLGSGIAGILLGYFLSVGFHKLFLIISLMLAMASFTVLLFDAPSPPGVLSAQTHTGNAHVQSSQVTIFSPNTTWLTLLFVLLIGMVVSQMSATYPIYINAMFADVKSVSILFTINTFLVVLFATPIGDVCQRLHKPMLVGVGGFLIGAGMWMLTLSHTFTFAILACCIYTFGEIIFFAFAQFICYHGYGSAAKGLGTFRAIYATSRMAGPAMGGFIYHTYSGQMVWIVSGLVGLLCLSSYSLYYWQEMKVTTSISYGES